MKTLLLLLIIVSFISPAAAPAADVEPAATESVGVKYLDVLNAYQALKEHHPDLADLVVSIQIQHNALLLKRDHPKAPAVRESLAQLDQPGRKVLLQAVISAVTESTGSETVLSRPTVFTLERQPTTIEVPLSANGDKKLKIVLTARSVPDIATGK